jgi:hypothetical protein
MQFTPLALLLLAAAPAFAAAHYDPDQDRAALRQAASSSYNAATLAAGVPLVPERAAEIRADLDESLARANDASTAAKNLETAAVKRAAEMAGELKGHGAPAPSADAKDLSDAAALQRARWKSLSKDHDDLQARVFALPDTNRDKADLKSTLRAAGDSLAAADAALGRAEADASAAADTVAQMELADKRARSSAAELTPQDTEVIRLADSLPPPVSEAKDATGLLGQEPQGPNRTRAGAKISVPRDLTSQMYSAADRACNRADDYHGRSSAFDRALASFALAKSSGASDLAAAKSALDKADASQAGVRDRLDHPKPQP